MGALFSGYPTERGQVFKLEDIAGESVFDEDGAASDEHRHASGLQRAGTIVLGASTNRAPSNAQDQRSPSNAGYNTAHGIADGEWMYNLESLNVEYQSKYGQGQGRKRSAGGATS